MNFLQLLLQHLLVYQPFPNLALTEEVIIFHVADSTFWLVGNRGKTVVHCIKQ